MCVSKNYFKYFLIRFLKNCYLSYFVFCVVWDVRKNNEPFLIKKKNFLKPKLNQFIIFQSIN
jgi:hypothetical protein